MKKPLGRIALPVDVIQKLRKVAAWQDQTGAQFARHAIEKAVLNVERRMARAASEAEERR